MKQIKRILLLFSQYIIYLYNCLKEIIFSYKFRYVCKNKNMHTHLAGNGYKYMLLVFRKLLVLNKKFICKFCKSDIYIVIY